MHSLNDSPRPYRYHKSLVCSSADNLPTATITSPLRPRRSNTVINRSRQSAPTSKRLSPVADRCPSDKLGLGTSATPGRREYITTLVPSLPLPSIAPKAVLSSSVTATKTLQRKPSKWRKLGGLFRTKPPESPHDEYFYQVQVNDKPLRPSKSPNFQPQPFTGTQYPSNAPQDPFNSSSSVDSRPPHHQQRPRRQRNVTDVSQSSSESPKQCRQGKKRTPAKLIKNAEIRKYWTQTSSEPESNSGLLRPKTSSPFLRVDIPSVEMERYSVMFGGVIDGSPPSLLARRSKVLNKLMIPGKEDPPPPQRRATSPAPSRSPSYSLFPSTPTDTKPNAAQQQFTRPIPSPRQRRSNTHPPPHKELFERWAHADSSGDLLPPFYTAAGDASDGSLYSPASFEEDDKYLNPVRLQVHPARLPEPDWEMVTPNQKSDDKKQNLKLHNRYPLISPTPSPHAPTDSQKTPTQSTNDKETPKPVSCHKHDQSLDSISDELHYEIRTAKISIARSVSLSKAQKQVLVPVNVNRRVLRSGERFVERAAGVPTQLAVQRGHRHEKSRNVLIENA